MLKNNLKTKKEKTFFVFELTESAIKVLKCSLDGAKREIVSADVVPEILKLDDKKLQEKIQAIFQKMGYVDGPLFISLPRANVTARYLKVPSHIPSEIERMVVLQAPRCIPYPADELNCGFQIIATDKEGYSEVNLVIVHKNVVERLIRIFRQLKYGALTVVCSSYGLANLLHHLLPQENAVTMLIDIDLEHVEVAYVCAEKLFFSRSFRRPRVVAGWENLFIEELKRTQDVFMREVTRKPPVKVIILKAGKGFGGLAEMIGKKINLPVEELDYAMNIRLPPEYSFAGLIGLGLEDPTDNLNLMPAKEKEAAKIISRKKDFLRLILSVSGVALIVAFGVLLSLENKAQYLKSLKSQLNSISKESKPLEEIQRRLDIIDGYSKKKLSSLDILYALYKSIPEDVSLINFIYEDDGRVVIRGQATGLNYVFEFVNRLEKSPVFKKFNIKVRYATKKQSAAGEFVDFEIVCSKED